MSNGLDSQGVGVIERPTYESEIGGVQPRLCDLGLDATHDDGFAHPYQGRSVGCGYGSCDDERTNGRVG